MTGRRINHFTTRPLVAETGIEPMTFGLWAQRATSALLRYKIYKIFLKKYYKIKDNLAGNEGFEPPRAFTPLPVFKTSPFSHLGNCPFWWI
ncbi:conserved hypothetical protein [Mesomycoplasma hyopneumoniae J]|uniref:Uncharacterized protein n=2 Tax=Mesomycoplasma hyopneumoniae TaxID=2099 RepID=A4Q7U7_MESHJ|nr:conserved hypothetical protein [Mesomycoplasma hyopneumoniae J]ABP01100.1 hypothetical protein MHP7448_0682 [Mesomycoplasma hyopneumoniae 7448]